MFKINIIIYLIVVRVSNLLNYSYFSEKELKKAIININKDFKRKCYYFNKQN